MEKDKPGGCMKKGVGFLYPLLVVAIFLFLGLSPERARAGIVINEKTWIGGFKDGTTKELITC
ncbi:MAG: hypothetical protein QME81_16460 [bacterium]|nr:hypothetical protein [bacterium]